MCFKWRQWLLNILRILKTSNWIYRDPKQQRFTTRLVNERSCASSMRQYNARGLLNSSGTWSWEDEECSRPMRLPLETEQYPATRHQSLKQIRGMGQAWQCWDNVQTDTCPVALETREGDGGGQESCHMYDERCSLRTGDLIKHIMIYDGYIYEQGVRIELSITALPLMDLMVWRSK